MSFGTLPPEEVKRRQDVSRARYKEIRRDEWAAQYQAKCDTLYWEIGKCCAGCDHWSSDGAMQGECSAAGIMSGEQVMLSMGIPFSSLQIEPGFPFTKSTHVCGLFRDDFDWSILADDYLEQIGAMRHGQMRAKP